MSTVDFSGLFNDVNVQVIVGHLNTVLSKGGTQILAQTKIDIPVTINGGPAENLVLDGAFLVVREENCGGGVLQNTGSHGDSLLAGFLYGFGGGLL